MMMNKERWQRFKCDSQKGLSTQCCKRLRLSFFQVLLQFHVFQTSYFKSSFEPASCLCVCDFNCHAIYIFIVWLGDKDLMVASKK